MPKEAWRESLGPRIEEVREQLQAVDPDAIHLRSGARRTEGGFELDLLGKAYGLTWPDLVLSFGDGSPCPEELLIMVLDYLVLADGTQPSGTWIGFQELPDGAFYRRAFQGYAGDQLIKDLDADITSFRLGAEALDGQPVDLGDAAYTFRALPHVSLAVVWWEGDEEFPANATVLFDRSASHYLPTDGLAILGRMLCRAIVKNGRAS